MSAEHIEKAEEYVDKSLDVARERYKAYRHSGLALSATYISLSLLLLSRLLGGGEQLLYTYKVSVVLLLLTVVFALSIQFFHYLGTKQEAEAVMVIVEGNNICLTYREEQYEGRGNKEEFIKALNGVSSEYNSMNSKAQRKFGIADWMVYISTGLFVIGSLYTFFYVLGFNLKP